MGYLAWLCCLTLSYWFWGFYYCVVFRYFVSCFVISILCFCIAFSSCSEWLPGTTDATEEDFGPHTENKTVPSKVNPIARVGSQVELSALKCVWGQRYVQASAILLPSQ